VKTAEANPRSKLAGLRGAIAFSLALNLKNMVKNYEIILTTTLTVVIFTIVVFGGGTFPLIQLIERCFRTPILAKKVNLVAAREKVSSVSCPIDFDLDSVQPGVCFGCIFYLFFLARRCGGHAKRGSQLV